MAGPVRNEISGGIFLSAVIQGRDLLLSLPPEVTPARSGLPAPTPGFCGRVSDLSTMVAALSPRQGSNDRETIVTVRGTAGVGKTELMLQAARVALANGQFPGGVLFADAGGHDGPGASRLLAGFLRALGVPPGQLPAGLQDRAALYNLILSAFARRGKRILILIDDLVPGGEAASLLPLDAASPSIVTSREPLRIPSGLELAVGALDPGDCAKLLHRVLNIAHDGDPRVAADPNAAARISGLCGGLPLALRIVGALLAENPALPLAEVADNLQEESSRLDELEYMGGGMRACFDLSYRHLDLESARFFRLLSVHPGPGFSAEEAASLADVDLTAARHGLSALSPLLEYDVVAREWRMPVLVRLYANEHGLRHAREDRRAQALGRLVAVRGLRPPTGPPGRGPG
jgi:hypothetical protein